MAENVPTDDPLTPPDDADPFDEMSPADDPMQDLDDEDPLAPVRPAWPLESD